jgi:hypothetical protein
MKVNLVYIVGFTTSNPDLQKETAAGMKGLEKKYQARGAKVITAMIQTGTTNPPFMTMQKNPVKVPQQQYLAKYGFSPFVDSDETDYLKGGDAGSGVGVYFLFHGRAESADVNLGPVVQITRWLMKKHPNGQLRKVVFGACGYGGTAFGSTSLLVKFGKQLVTQTAEEELKHLPKVAAWANFITVNEDGSKTAATPKDPSTYKPAKSLASAAKRVLVMEGDGYAEKFLTGPQDPLWHDPDVITEEGKNKLIPNPLNTFE